MGWKKEIFYLHSFLLLLEDGKILMQAIADDLAIAQWIETQNCSYSMALQSDVYP